MKNSQAQWMATKWKTRKMAQGFCPLATWSCLQRLIGVQRAMSHRSKTRLYKMHLEYSESECNVDGNQLHFFTRTISLPNAHISIVLLFCILKARPKCFYKYSKTIFTKVYIIISSKRQSFNNNQHICCYAKLHTSVTNQFKQHIIWNNGTMMIVPNHIKNILFSIKLLEPIWNMLCPSHTLRN